MKWVATLSSGEVVEEGTPVPGKLSPWQGLVQRCRSGQIHLVRLALEMDGMAVLALPEAAGYVQCTEVITVVGAENEKRRRGIGAVVGNAVVMTWVDDKNIYQDIRPLADMRLHSTVNLENEI